MFRLFTADIPTASLKKAIEKFQRLVNNLHDNLNLGGWNKLIGNISVFYISLSNFKSMFNPCFNYF